MESSALFSLLRQWLLRERVLVLLLTMACAYFAYMYVVDGTRPGMLAPLGWFGFWDQSQYLGMARAMSEWGLEPAEFQYGLGYPAIAVPFVWMGLDYDPFAVFNGVAFVFIVGATYVVARRAFGTLAGLLAGFGIAFASPMVGFTVTPWNSTVSTVCLLGVLLIATSGRTSLWQAAVLGLLVGWAFSARYVDVVWLGIIAATIIGMRWRGRQAAVAGLLALMAVLIFVVPVLAIQWQVLGSPFTTPYAQHISQDATESDQQLSSYDVEKIPESAFGVLVSPFLLDGEVGTPLLASFFWALLAIPGLFLAMRGPPVLRSLWIAVGSAALLASLFYLSFRGMGGGTLKFGALHYVKMWWPAAAILAAACIARVASSRPGSVDASSEGP